MSKKKRENWIYLTSEIKYGKTVWAKGVRIKPSTLKIGGYQILERILTCMSKGSYSVAMEHILKHSDWVKSNVET